MAVVVCNTIKKFRTIYKYIWTLNKSKMTIFWGAFFLLIDTMFSGGNGPKKWHSLFSSTWTLFCPLSHSNVLFASKQLPIKWKYVTFARRTVNNRKERACESIYYVQLSPIFITIPTPRVWIFFMIDFMWALTFNEDWWELTNIKFTSLLRSDFPVSDTESYFGVLPKTNLTVALGVPSSFYQKRDSKDSRKAGKWKILEETTHSTEWIPSTNAPTHWLYKH